MSYQIRIEQFPGHNIAVVKRSATPSRVSKVITDACGLVWNAIKAEGIKGAGRHVAVYYEQFLKMEIGVEMESPIEAIGEVASSMLPAGDVATTTHFGPYQQLGEAHDAIHAWCRANGRVPAPPCWEIYGHWLDDWNNDPRKIRTDVYYLLKSLNG
jgi:effector-binding domain-containing protein